MDLAWLPNSSVWRHPLFNLWTRRWLVPEHVGGSSVDIVSFGLFAFGDRIFAVWFVVLFLSIMLLLYNLLAWVFGSASPLRVECPLVFFCLLCPRRRLICIEPYFSVWVPVCFPGSDWNDNLSVVCGTTGCV